MCLYPRIRVRTVQVQRTYAVYPTVNALQVYFNKTITEYNTHLQYVRCIVRTQVHTVRIGVVGNIFLFT